MLTKNSPKTVATNKLKIMFDAIIISLNKSKLTSRPYSHILYTCIYYVFIISLIYLMNSFFCKIIITEVSKTVLDFVIILFEFQFSRNCKNGYYSIYIYLILKFEASRSDKDFFNNRAP